MCLIALLIATVFYVYVDDTEKADENLINYDSLISYDLRQDKAILVDSMPFNPNALILDSLTAVNTLDSLNLASEVIGYKLRISIEKAKRNLKVLEKLNTQSDTLR